MFGAILGIVVGYVVHVIAVQNGSGTDLLGNPWIAMGYGALLGCAAFMGGT